MPNNYLGAAHVCFKVEDVRATKAELEAKGVQFYSDVNVVDEGPLAGWRWVYFSDPDGLALELVEIAYYLKEERKPRGRVPAHPSRARVHSSEPGRGRRVAIRTFGTNSVDWETRLDMDRLRRERLARLKAELDRSDSAPCCPSTSTTSAT